MTQHTKVRDGEWTRFVLLRFSRFGSQWAVNITRRFYLTNNAYPGQRRWYVRLGKRPGWVRSFGPVQRERAESPPVEAEEGA